MIDNQDHTSIIEDAKAAAEILRMQEVVDDADRRAGFAERQLGYAQDTISKTAAWRDRIKVQLGYDVSVSFDQVWSDTLAKAQRNTGIEGLADGLEILRTDIHLADAFIAEQGNRHEHLVNDRRKRAAGFRAILAALGEEA